ncbi:amidohydrolase family protein [Klebsiella pneumoniae]|nr:amidohydrolase family protein [Klebsiella pneumoniae]
MRYQADILIDKGRIQKIASFIPSRPEWLVIDVRGKWVIPGMIDDQVHFREPGLTHKGTIATESAAAVMGGITSFMEMPNVTPPTTTRQALREKFQRASRSSLANHSFYFGATNDNLDELKALTASQACGVKVFMGASTGNMLVDDEQVLESIFANAPCLVATHCEHTPTIKQNEAIWRARFGVLFLRRACRYSFCGRLPDILPPGRLSGEKTSYPITCSAHYHRRRTCSL